MQEKSNSGPEEASTEGMVDQCEQQTQAMQIRTFTRWMNLLLQKCDPPLMVHDLLAEVRDGQVLMALLEQLSGCKLLYRFRSSPQRIFRLNNISKVLSFLEDRHVKLPGVDLSGITDGVPSAVLNLIWSIILHFQVKLVVQRLKGHLSSSHSSSRLGSHCSKPSLQMDGSSGSSHSSSSSSSSYSCRDVPRKGREVKVEPISHGKTMETLLQLVQMFTSRFGMEVHDFGKSWRSGMAIMALIKSINPALVDLRESFSDDPKETIELAFEIAHRCLDIPPLLESDDLLCTSPDEQCIVTYVSMFLKHYTPTEACAMNIHKLSNTESPEPAGFGGTHAYDPEAQVLLKGLQTSSALLLWKKWSRKPSGISEQSASCAATLPAGRKRSTGNLPSPLDTGVLSQEIQSWMKEADQTYTKRRLGGSCLSLSSEEGIYSLPALDSEDDEEEETSSHILDLRQQFFPPLAPRARLEVIEMSKSETLEKYERKTDKSGCSGMVRSTDVFDSQSEEKNISQGEECGAQRAVTAQRNDGGSSCCEEVIEKAGLMTHRWDKTPSEADETQEFFVFEVEGRRKEPQEQSRTGPSENSEAASETAKEDDSLTTFGGARDETRKIKRKACWREGKEDRDVCEVTGAGEVTVYTEQQDDGKVKVDDLTGEGRGEGRGRGARIHIDLTPITGAKEKNRRSRTDGFQFKTGTEKSIHFGDILWSQTFSATGQSRREEGLTLEASVARCDITPLELETLLALWIVIYCYFILHQMNS